MSSTGARWLAVADVVVRDLAQPHEDEQQEQRQHTDKQGSQCPVAHGPGETRLDHGADEQLQRHHDRRLEHLGQPPGGPVFGTDRRRARSLWNP